MLETKFIISECTQSTQYKCTLYVCLQLLCKNHAVLSGESLVRKHFRNPQLCSFLSGKGIMGLRALPGLLAKCGGQGVLCNSKNWYGIQIPVGERVGPDRILPANSLTTSWPDGTVEIRFSNKHPSCNNKPISVRYKSENFRSNWIP